MKGRTSGIPWKEITQAFKVFTLFAFLAGALAFAEGTSEKLPESLEIPTTRANCELHLLEPSQAGSVYLSTFASTKEECLKMSDPRTRAEFKKLPTRAARTPIGPKED